MSIKQHVKIIVPLVCRVHAKATVRVPKLSHQRLRVNTEIISGHEKGKIQFQYLHNSGLHTASSPRPYGIKGDRPVYGRQLEVNVYTLLAVRLGGGHLEILSILLSASK